MAPTKDPAEHYERRYTPRGRVAHLIFAPSWSRDAVPHAACGWWASKDYWRGTGNQDEYDKAASLVVCKRCQAAVTR